MKRIYYTVSRISSDTFVENIGIKIEKSEELLPIN
jgi:hypothetical protein